MILQLAEISVKPFKEVLTRFKKYRAKGWGAIALSFGIKPGSDVFRAWKENIPLIIQEYGEVEITGLKDSKGSKKYKKGSKKHKKGSKGSKKHKKGSK